MGEPSMFRQLCLVACALIVLAAMPVRALACEGNEGSEVIFEDKFTDDAGGWALNNAVEVKDGSFALKLAPDDLETNLNVTFTVENADICSEVVWPEGDPVTLGAGLLFWGLDNKNYFQFGILDSGKYWIARKLDGKWQTIVENIDSSAINTAPGGTNTLRVKASGNTASFYINGTKVRDLRGQPPKSGWRFGLSGDNFDKEKETRLVFKSVKVTN
jgi:hypothetical protein